MTGDMENKFNIYASLLLKWNEKINLIGRSTAAEVRTRHVVDSEQILPLILKELESITPPATIMDFGSGAGLPAIIIAIVLQEKNIDAQVIACESNSKKASFLNTAASELNLKNFKVENKRIEDITGYKADIFTARAFAELKLIFEMAEKFQKDTSKFILHKGENLEKELIEADKYFEYKHSVIKSVTGTGFVLSAEGVKPKT